MMRNAALLALLAVLLLLAPAFVYPATLMTILCFAVFACSFNLMLGYAGLLCFGHAMFFGAGAYVTGYVLKNTTWPPELGIMAAMIAMAVLGLLVGLVCIRKAGIQFAMITFAIAQFVYFVHLRAPFTGGEDGMQSIPRRPVLGVIDVTADATYYYVVLTISVVALLAFYRIVHSPFGEALKAVRDNDPRMESLGFKPDRLKLLGLVLAAGLAGLAGGLKATVFQIATLNDLSFVISFEVILMTLLGGLGTLSGPIVGAIVIVVLNDQLAAFGEWALIAQGAILLVVIIFFRKGFVGELNALIEKRRAALSARG